MSKDRNSLLFNVPPVVDPSYEIAEVLVKALEWNMLSREWKLTVSEQVARIAQEECVSA